MGWQSKSPANFVPGVTRRTHREHRLDSWFQTSQKQFHLELALQSGHTVDHKLALLQALKRYESILFLKVPQVLSLEDPEAKRPQIPNDFAFH